jgi:hypothetical protein
MNFGWHSPPPVDCDRWGSMAVRRGSVSSFGASEAGESDTENLLGDDDITALPEDDVKDTRGSSKQSASVSLDTKSQWLSKLFEDSPTGTNLRYTADVMWQVKKKIWHGFWDYLFLVRARRAGVREGPPMTRVAARAGLLHQP